MAAISSKKMFMKFSKTLTMGIVGLPNVGKSLLFNLLAHRNIAGTANYPFCTVDPNEASVEVPDERFNWLCQLFKPRREISATLSVTDIAGLVRGASTGAGLGNEFLSNIRNVNGIFQVVRIFDDPEITHVEDTIDPVRDIKIIHEELRAKDIDWVTKTFTDLEKKMKMDPQKFKDEFALVKKILDYLTNNEKPIRCANWNAVETEYIENLCLLTAKPNIFLLNMDRKGYLTHRNRHLAAAVKFIKEFSDEPTIPFSAVFEQELEEMDKSAVDAFLAENKTHSMIPRIIQNGFHDLGLINFFTCGPDEVRGWTVRNGATAPIAGGVIHSDFQNMFIKAMVYHFEDLKQYGNENAVKAAGKYRTEGKNYVVQDGDIMFFMHGNSSSGSKKK